ncbi:MAG: hypothetical protein A2091_07915 [Desulfuromonadales bacterium GWD2_61_12]|nr:MAG: hypothetical protein A2091_07915 [Desulfuromonadales bacterium GWD2_61_12]
MTVISATGVGEVASWDENAKHGLLTSYFLKAIDGEADKGKTGNNNQQIELEEVKKYLELEVPYMARRLYGREQHPQISGNSTSVISTYVD